MDEVVDGGLAQLQARTGLSHREQPGIGLRVLRCLCHGSEAKHTVTSWLWIASEIRAACAVRFAAVPGQPSTDSSVALEEARLALRLSLRETARLVGISPRALARYGAGERALPEGVARQALDQLLSRAQPEQTVLERIREPALSPSAARRRLPPKLRPVLDAMVAAGRLVERREASRTRDGRLYVRSLLVPRSSERPSGLDRSAPTRLAGRELRAARRFKGRRVVACAERVGVASATWRSWEARGVPPARAEEVGRSLEVLGGPEIRQLREAAGWSLAELAERVGVTFSVVQAWEAGKRPVPHGRVVALLATLDEARRLAQERSEALVASIVEEVRARPAGVSESALRHEHRQAGGRVSRSGDYGAALDEAKRRGLLVEAALPGYAADRVRLFAADDAPAPLPRLSGDELRQRRERIGVSQAELAARCEVSAPTIIAAERLVDGQVSARLRSVAPGALAELEAEGRRSAEARRESTLLEAIAAKPGSSTSDLYQLEGLGYFPKLKAALRRLEAAGKARRAPALDALGRTYLGWYLAAEVPPPLETLSGAELRGLREAAGWSRPALAQALGIDASRLGEWESERGRRRCPTGRVGEVRRILATAPPAPGLTRAEVRILEDLVARASVAGGASPSALGWPQRRRHIELALELGRLEEGFVDVQDPNGRIFRRRRLFPAGTALPAHERPSLSAAELVALRRRVGLSQAALGELLGVAGVTVSGWETGRVAVPARHVGAILALAKGPAA